VVGGTSVWADPANSTSPTLNFSGRLSMKLTAASWAALSRLGSTSVASIDSDVSIASISVAFSVGTVTSV
jgi:hypothetical protein